MSKIKREQLFKKYGGKCAYCGCDLKQGWHSDHIEPIRRNPDGSCLHPENDFLENYNPACASCNIQKNSLTLEQFRDSIKQFVASLNLYNTQYKFAKRYGLITENDIDVKFYFEIEEQS